ncbi:MAG: PAS domain-containing protein [Myxococcota bacterium]|nr:PAS domain-containing protein [Myxococcota bacterium]
MSTVSLLSFIDAPVVVGDPDGTAAYVNPAFEACFAVSGQQVKGQPLALLFEGGVREAVLSAVAEVCTQGASARFRVRHAGAGYAGVASPIVAEDARVGFVILLFENHAEHERLHAIHRKLQQPIEEVSRLLDAIGEQTRNDFNEKVESLLEEGAAAVDTMRRASTELTTLLTGKRAESREDSFDPAPVARDAARRLSEEFASAQVTLEVRVPGSLPLLPGDPERFRGLVVQLLRNRLAACSASASVSLQAGALERSGIPSVVLRVVHTGAGGAPEAEAPWAEPDTVTRLVQEIGGEMRVGQDASGGRATAIRLIALTE